MLKTFLTLFLHTHLPQEEHAEYLANPDKVDQMLLTPRMGDRCGRELGLQKVMRWTPAIVSGGRALALQRSVAKHALTFTFVN